MKVLKRIEYWALSLGCRFVGALPTWFLYHCLLDLIYFIVYKVVKYRLSVVRMNLKNSFPEYSDAKLLDVERRFYRHLAEIFVDTIDLSNISAKELKERMIINNIEQVEAECGGKSWIAAFAHYGSWEYFGVSQFYTNSQVVAVYKPLHNQSFEEFYVKSRTRFGVTTVAMNSLLRYIVKNIRSPKPLIVGLIADQSPNVYDIDHWYDFLNQHTPFFPGMEKLATKFGMPVYFLNIKKISRAHYEVNFERIYDGVEEVEPHEVITRYAEKLEIMIRECPELWMWSHKRWKHQPRKGAEYNVKL